jgi:hypothetical protein
MFNFALGSDLAVYFFRKENSTYGLSFFDKRNNTKVVLGLEEIFKVFTILEEEHKQGFKQNKSFEISSRPTQWQGIQTLKLEVMSQGTRVSVILGVYLKNNEEDVKERKSRFYCHFSNGYEVTRLQQFKETLLSKLKYMQLFENTVATAYLTFYQLFMTYKKANVYSVPEKSLKSMFFTSLKVENFIEQCGFLITLKELKQINDMLEEVYVYLLKHCRSDLEILFDTYENENIEIVKQYLEDRKERIIHEQISPFVAVNQVPANKND